MTVYVDGVFVLNFAVNYLLLRGTGRLGAAALQNQRLLLGAGVGAIYAVAVYLPGLNFLTFFLWKLLVAGAMVGCAYGFRRGSLRLGAVFGGLTLALGGAIYGTQRILNGRAVYGSSDLFYPVTFFTLLLTAAAVCWACRLLLPRLEHSKDSLVPLRLGLNGKAVCLSALRDSGNTLRDPITGAEVITVWWRSMQKLLPDGLCNEDFSAPAALALRLQPLSPRLIPYRAVGIPSGLLLAIPCEITQNRQTKIGLVALSPNPLSDGGAYEALIGGQLYV